MALKGFGRQLKCQIKGKETETNSHRSRKSERREEQNWKNVTQRIWFSFCVFESVWERWVRWAPRACSVMSWHSQTVRVCLYLWRVIADWVRHLGTVVQLRHKTKWKSGMTHYDILLRLAQYNVLTHTKDGHQYSHMEVPIIKQENAIIELTCL